VHAAPGTDAIGVLDRITAIFEAFEDDDPGLAISTLAARTGLAKSTVSRLVADLVRQGYLERDGRLVRLGLRLFELGQLAERPQQLRSAASSVMADLRAATGASIHLALRDGDDSTYVAILRGRMPAPPFARTGGRVPPGAALGRAIRHAAEIRETESGMACVARPVRSAAGDVVAAISMCGPVAELDPEVAATELRTAVRTLEHRLEGGGAPPR
jgi:DNA-binding IclR family transcriptional regulator